MNDTDYYRSLFRERIDRVVIHNHGNAPPELCDDPELCTIYLAPPIFRKGKESARFASGRLVDTKKRNVPAKRHLSPPQLCDDAELCWKYHAPPIARVGINKNLRFGPHTRLIASVILVILTAIIIWLIAKLRSVLRQERQDYLVQRARYEAWLEARARAQAQAAAGQAANAQPRNEPAEVQAGCNANRDVQSKTSSEICAKVKDQQLFYESDDDDGPCCWICLREGHDEVGQPLVRDCSCRGETAGWVHLSCLIEYAERRSKYWVGKPDPEIFRFREPWRKCPNCCQAFQNQLAVDLADRFISFVAKEFPGDLTKEIEGYCRKLTVSLLLSTTVKPEVRKEVRDLAKKMFAITEVMKAQDSPLPSRIHNIGAVIHNGLGCVALSDRTKEDARIAEEHFKQSRDIFKKIGFVEGVAAAENNIIIAQNQHKEGGPEVKNAKYLEKRQELYKHRVATFGENAQSTLGTGLNLALDLWGASRSVEAQRLATKLVLRCNRIHGPDHRLSKTAKSTLAKIKLRFVNIKYEHSGWTQLRALRYEENGELRICPTSTPIGLEYEKSCLVGPTYYRPILGTPIICHGMEDTPHLNGKIGELRRQVKSWFEVHFEDKDIEPCIVRSRNVRILFEIPDNEDK